MHRKENVKTDKVLLAGVKINFILHIRQCCEHIETATQNFRPSLPYDGLQVYNTDKKNADKTLTNKSSVCLAWAVFAMCLAKNAAVVRISCLASVTSLTLPETLIKVC